MVKYNSTALKSSSGLNEHPELAKGFDTVAATWVEALDLIRSTTKYELDKYTRSGRYMHAIVRQILDTSIVEEQIRLAED